MTVGLAGSPILPATTGPGPASEMATAQPLVGTNVGRPPPHGSLTIDVAEVDMHVVPLPEGPATAGAGAGSHDQADGRLSERSSGSSAASSAGVSSSSRSVAHTNAKLRRARQSATNRKMAAQLVETQAEMLRMMARLQEQHAKLAASVDRIQNAVGLASASGTPLVTPKDEAAASDSSEEDFTTFGL